MGLAVSGSKKRVIPTWRDVGVSEVGKDRVKKVLPERGLTAGIPLNPRSPNPSTLALQ